MPLLELLTNSLNRALGRKQDFYELLASHDISAVKSSMQTREELILNAMQEYNTKQHKVNNREPKIITDKKGNIVKRIERWKLPVPYPVYINEIALVFLYGRPVKWMQMSDHTDNAFAKFQDVIKKTRFDSKIRQCKRLAGAETQSAMLFRVFKDDDGNPDLQIRVLAKSKGDEIYVKRDQYENIISMAWGYYVSEKGKAVYHFDVFTPDVIYRCTQRALGWDVETEINFIGKIPLILFEQEKEWKGVENLINREEWIASRTADTNDYFADPIAVFNSDIIKNLPDKKEEAKTLYAKNGEGGVDKALKYVTWDNAPQSKKDEMEWLQTQILSKSFTPNITLDTLKSISQLSAKALRTVMMLADIKAARHKEVHDELLDRTASLLVAIIGNVLDISLSGECENLQIMHEFQEPFGDDIADDLNDIIRAVEGGILSTESAIELNPLVKDITRERERIKQEKQEAVQLQQSLFADPMGAGAQSYTDGDDDEDEDPEDTKKKQPKKNDKK